MFLSLSSIRAESDGDPAVLACWSHALSARFGRRRSQTGRRRCQCEVFFPFLCRVGTMLTGFYLFSQSDASSENYHTADEDEMAAQQGQQVSPEVQAAKDEALAGKDDAGDGL